MTCEHETEDRTRLGAIFEGHCPRCLVALEPHEGHGRCPCCSGCWYATGGPDGGVAHTVVHGVTRVELTSGDGLGAPFHLSEPRVEVLHRLEAMRSADT